MSNIDKTPSLSEQFQRRIDYFTNKKYKEVRNDTPQNQISRSKEIIKYLQGDIAFPDQKLKSKYQSQINDTIALYQKIIDTEGTITKPTHTEEIEEIEEIKKIKK